MSLLCAIGLAVVALLAGFVAGHRLGQADRTIRQFVEQARRLRQRPDVLELQRRARGEG